ncbi:MAG TPA: VOC family protein [Actinomycetes bacterium]|nr:VOC family protein [Actinomycetes bacterium]
MPLGPQTHIRIARPSRDLAAAERFWVDGLGLQVLWRSEPEGPAEHALLMVGWPNASWHLELVADPSTLPAPTEEDLLVLYVGDPIDDALVRRLLAHGGARVQPRNPYWDRWGVSIVDPDGYCLVLSHRSWG